ncbi:uncharacterized protein LOC128269912 [Anopheles cruzii]|uniref:uncharacterized protein LOC128269912 n=1 Tax=Anopheles cruzii TaxID=68878 RepID=UPI0022EC675D|nr:uncharacterized protein LOC128269912 [Anopheles cruzii]
MCSAVTYKVLCWFYALCHLYLAYCAILNAGGISRLIGKSDCATESGSERAEEQTCNVTLVTASALDCFMSLLMLGAVTMRKTTLLKAYMAYLWIRFIFCFYMWLTVWNTFRTGDAKYVPFSVWALVLVLFCVYYSLELWVMKGAHDAIGLEWADRDAVDCCCLCCLRVEGFIP